MVFMKCGTKEEQHNYLVTSRHDLAVNAVDIVQNACMTLRKLAKLKPIKDTGEACMGLTDKIGRVCRQLKHIIRKDPKPDARREVEDAMGGALVYLMLLAERHELSLGDGLSRELHKAMEQHKEKPNGNRLRKQGRSHKGS